MYRELKTKIQNGLHERSESVAGLRSQVSLQGLTLSKN